MTFQSPHNELPTEAEANTVYRRALSSKEALFGVAHLEVALTCHNLGASLHEREQHQEAEALLSRALPILSSTLSPSQPTLLACQQALFRGA